MVGHQLIGHASPELGHTRLGKRKEEAGVNTLLLHNLEVVRVVVLRGQDWQTVAVVLVG